MSDDLRRVVLAIHIYEGLLRNSDPETVLDAILNDPAIEVVALPEPDAEGEWHLGALRVNAESGSVLWPNAVGQASCSPEWGRKYAAALLAAARKAESDA